MNNFFDEETKKAFKVIGIFLFAVLCFYMIIWEIQNTILGYIPLFAAVIVGFILVCIPIVPLALISIISASFLHIFKKLKELIKKPS